MEQSREKASVKVLKRMGMKGEDGQRAKGIRIGNRCGRNREAFLVEGWYCATAMHTQS